MTQPMLPITNPALVLLPAHERMLLAVNRYGLLTAAQATRLISDSRSLTRMQTRMKELADAGLLHRHSPGRSGPRGSLPLVYTLDRRGRQHLRVSGSACRGASAIGGRDAQHDAPAAHAARDRSADRPGTTGAPRAAGADRPDAGGAGAEGDAGARDAAPTARPRP